MASKPETKFRAKFRKRLEAIPYSWWESIQQKSIHGTPDILGCVHGHFVGLELKASIDAPISALQKVKIHRIREAHGIAMVVYPENADEAIDFLLNLGNT